MRRLLKSEVLKLRSTPTMWWLLAGMVLLTVVACVGAFALQEAAQVARTSDIALRSDLHAIGSGSIFVAVAGMIGMAGEFRFGQADQTYISTPRRSRVLAAKVIVFGVLGLIFGIIAAIITVGTMMIWFSTKSESLPFDSHSVWLTLAGAIISAMAFGVLGVVIGAVTKNQVVAIVGALAWIVIIEPIVFQASAELGKWFPGQAAEALRRVPVDGLLSMGTGTAVLTAWILLLAGAGIYRTARGDIA
jgi:ABC-2 type transport system permease protein